MGDKGGNACKGNVVFLTHCACCYAQVLGMKKPKSKIGQCSGIGKFCPPDAALPELMRGNKFEPLCCAIEGGGGDVINKIGRRAHLPCQNSFSCFRVSFLEAREAPGSSL
jgi:hypothetical protein